MNKKEGFLNYLKYSFNRNFRNLLSCEVPSPKFDQKLDLKPYLKVHALRATHFFFFFINKLALLSSKDNGYGVRVVLYWRLQCFSGTVQFNLSIILTSSSLVYLLIILFPANIVQSHHSLASLAWKVHIHFLWTILLAWVHPW